MGIPQRRAQRELASTTPSREKATAMGRGMRRWEQTRQQEGCAAMIPAHD